MMTLSNVTSCYANVRVILLQANCRVEPVGCRQFWNYFSVLFNM